MSNEIVEPARNPERLNDLNYLEEVAESFDPEGEDEDIDALYKYAQLLYSGSDEIEEDKERAIELFALVFTNLYLNDLIGDVCEYDYEYEYDYERINENMEEGGANYQIAVDYKDMFLAAEYFTNEGFAHDICLGPIAKIIRYGVPGVMEPDPARAFELELNMPQPVGMFGGFGLLDTVLRQDLNTLSVGDCFMLGKGVDIDLAAALQYYLCYRTDHIAQKHHTDLIRDRMEVLYSKLEYEIRNNPDSDDVARNYLAIAKMTMEGLGCTACPTKAKEYLNMAKDIAARKDTYIEDLMEIIDEEYLDRLIAYDAKPYEDNMELKPNDHVILYKYDNRSVFWKVLDVKDGKALLLSDEALESSYIFGARQKGEDWAKRGIMYMCYPEYDENEFEEYCDDEPEPEEEDKTIGISFYLTKDMVEKYLPDPEDRICFYRCQALRNSTDNEDWGNDTVAPWWLLAPDDEESEERFFVDEDGYIRKGNYHYDNGIRPAMYVRAKT